MGNRICLYEDCEIENSLKMSNGLTTVFIDVLALAGCALAKTEKEKDLVCWLLEHDQNVHGIGMVGFDIQEMPWSKNSFEIEKKFVLNIIEAAISKSNWEALDYSPDEEMIMEALDQFKNLIQIFNPDFINDNAYLEWKRRPAGKCIPIGYPMCSKHPIILHACGCILCGC